MPNSTSGFTAAELYQKIWHISVVISRNYKEVTHFPGLQRRAEKLIYSVSLVMVFMKHEDQCSQSERLFLKLNPWRRAVNCTAAAPDVGGSFRSIPADCRLVLCRRPERPHLPSSWQRNTQRLPGKRPSSLQNSHHSLWTAFTHACRSDTGVPSIPPQTSAVLCLTERSWIRELFDQRMCPSVSFSICVLSPVIWANFLI